MFIATQNPQITTQTAFARTLVRAIFACAICLLRPSTTVTNASCSNPRVHRSYFPLATRLRRDFVAGNGT